MDQLLVDGLLDFETVALGWTLVSKSGRRVPFELNPCQAMVETEYARQMAQRGFARINVLKLRQGGITTYCTGRGVHGVMCRPVTALTLAHDDKLPPVWLSRCRQWRDQTPWKPDATATQRNELAFARLGSRYYVGSAKGGFPGMGDCISYLHLSECGSWDKSPVAIDPDKVMEDLQPAIPNGRTMAGSVIIRESTGKMRGDWWHRQYVSAKDHADEFSNIFIPWFIAPEYRRDDMTDEILSLSQYESELVRYASSEFGVYLDTAQLAWRRHSIRQSPYLGNIETWGCRYPAYEDEAFLSPGLSIYTPDMIAVGRQTQRPEVWRGNILIPGSPSSAKFERNDSGEMKVWDWPNDRHHYVVGADCQWGRRKEADFDVLYVECLETGKLCAKVKGQWPMNLWAQMIAAVGHRYNSCPVAPERNAQAGSASDGVLPALLGNSGHWSYPNVWVRTKDHTIRPRVQDYGWYTDHVSKGAAISLSQARTSTNEFDWCDEECVDQMATIIRHDNGDLAAPEGAHDDDWMARLITYSVANQERATLATKPKDTRQDLPEEQLEFIDLIEKLEAEERDAAMDSNYENDDAVV